MSRPRYTELVSGPGRSCPCRETHRRDSRCNPVLLWTNPSCISRDYRRVTELGLIAVLIFHFVSAMVLPLSLIAPEYIQREVASWSHPGRCAACLPDGCQSGRRRHPPGSAGSPGCPERSTPLSSRGTRRLHNEHTGHATLSDVGR